MPLCWVSGGDVVFPDDIVATLICNSFELLAGGLLVIIVMLLLNELVDVINVSAVHQHIQSSLSCFPEISAINHSGDSSRNYASIFRSRRGPVRLSVESVSNFINVVGHNLFIGCTENQRNDHFLLGIIRILARNPLVIVSSGEETVESELPGGPGGAARDDVGEAGLSDLLCSAEDSYVLGPLPVINILDLQITFVDKLDNSFSGDRFLD